jgi:hypothetical protein
MASASERSSAARIAADISWARTPNRSERTAAARANSPVSYEYWLRKIKTEGSVREVDQPAAAASAHRAYMAQLGKKSRVKRRAAKTGAESAS